MKLKYNLVLILLLRIKQNFAFFMNDGIVWRQVNVDVHLSVKNLKTIRQRFSKFHCAVFAAISEIKNYSWCYGENKMECILTDMMVS